MANQFDRGALARRWVHSHEEDSAGEMVFRPDSYRFPPSRGRRSFELRPDGTMTDHGIGPDDRPSVRSGTWTLKETNELHLQPVDPNARTTVMRITYAALDKLVVKKDV